MKFLTLLSVLFVSCAVFAQTYRSGGVQRANFGGQQTQQQNGGKKSAAPGANSAVKTRTFTNYGAKHTWSRGVQTKGVQTTTAGTPVQENVEDVPAAVTSAEKNVPQAAKKAAAAAAAANAKAAPSAPAQHPQKDQQQAAAMPAEAVAAMQQLQGMQDMMKGLGGAMPAAAGGANAPAGAAGLPAGMPNIPGMPDLSALMGGAAAGQPSGTK